ncbi:GNAT family N-acetyltransferase [Burkholderiaceae bacterium DAT-1]|nr:GNAT family N-acetyltransferase [Burkholderiaceae bacterium DAT-1]
MLDPVLIALPDSIRTTRLILRPPQAGDGQHVFSAVIGSLNELLAFPASMRWLSATPTLDAMERWCRLGQANSMLRKDLPWLAFRQDTGLLVGVAELHHPDWQFRTFETGWWGRTSECGRGLMSEATRALHDFAFSELQANRIFALVDTENQASIRLAHRIGMIEEGIMRHERCDADGTPRHMHLFARTRV